MSASMMKAVDVEGRRILVRGTVQGVGFRPWVYRLAVEEGLSGRVRNDARGRHDRGLRAPRGPRGLPAAPRDGGSAGRRIVREVREEPIPAEAARRLRDRPRARGEGARRVSIPPDLATCPECLREVRDPADRRHRYPFTNCTHCGPALHDRPRRALRPAGHDDGRLRDVRRLPARVRGPRSTAASTRSRSPAPPAGRGCGCSAPSGEPGGRRRRRRSRRPRPALRDGRIVAVKGLGGYHLACDATSSDGRAAPARAQAARREAVRGDGRATSTPREPLARARRRRGAPARLGRAADRPRAAAARQRPRRPRSRPATRSSACCSPTRRCTTSCSRPRGRPLVMTSGNLSEEPMAARRRRGARAARAASPTSSSPTTARSRTAATTRWPA